MSASTVTGPCKGADTRSRQIFHARPNHDEDVIVGDLQATLDAHRATNRASIIHFVQDDNETHYSYMRPTIQYISDKTQHVKNEGRTPSKRTPRKGRIIYGHWDLTGARQHRVLNFGSKKVAEYEGVYIPPTGHWSLDGNTLENMERPWLDYLRDRGGDAFSRLQAEIMAFHAYISPTPTETLAQTTLIAGIKEVASRTLPDNPIEVIGSHRTGLATSLSDLDFRLSLPQFEKPVDQRAPSTTRPQAAKASIRLLRRLSKALFRQDDYQDIELRHGRIPIISAVHCATGHTIQIQAMSDTIASREYVLNYLAEFPTLHPLYTLIKTMLEIRNLRDVRVGGLGAYSIFMMVVAALKESEGTIALNDISRQLLFFLEFWSNTDLYCHGISVEPLGIFLKSRSKPSKKTREADLGDPVLRGQMQIGMVNDTQPYLLCLQDPANPLNDLGNKSYAIKHVQALFRATRESLRSKMDNLDRLLPPESTPRMGHEGALLDALIGADYRWLNSQRRRTSTWTKEPPSHVERSANDATDPGSLKEVRYGTY